jgi:hypothetical protein
MLGGCAITVPASNLLLFPKLVVVLPAFALETFEIYK